MLILSVIGFTKLKSVQRSGTEVIRTQLQPSKRIREILKLVKIQREHMVNPVSSYCPKGGHSATETEKNNMNTRKVKRHRNSDTKTCNREPQQSYRIGTVMNYWGGG